MTPYIHFFSTLIAATWRPQAHINSLWARCTA